MNYQKFRKIMLGGGLLLSLILPAAGSANTKTSGQLFRQGVVGENEKVVYEYRSLTTDYIGNCVDWETSRASGEKLKRCLTVARTLRDKLDRFLQACESIVGESKRAGKWKKELDDYFEKNAAKHGADATIIAETRQDGGLRASYQKRSANLKNSKADFNDEVKKLETRIEENASLGNQLFQAISYRSNAASATGRARTFTAIIRDAGATAVHIVVSILFCC